MNHRLRSNLYVRSLEDRTVPALFTVMNLSDSGAGTLRAAVSSANSAAGADTIAFQAGLVGTIFLMSGELSVNNALTIQGPGSSVIFISGNNTNRIFNVSTAAAGTAINISGLTLQEAKSTGSGGAIFGDNQNLTLANCALAGNKTTSTGGAAVAMTAGGTFKATDCTFTGNSAAGFGGALNLFGNGTSATLTRCTISGNSGGTAGGAYIAGDLLMDSCTVSNNTTPDVGGGLLLSNQSDATAIFTIRNSTISGNNGGTRGGAICVTYFHTTLKVQNSTLTNNTAVQGGAIRQLSNSTGSIVLESTVVSGNTASSIHPDISSGGTVSMNFCAVGSNDGFVMTNNGGNLPFQPHANLKLGPLAKNGGPTQTHLSTNTSPLVNAGNNALALTTDQRGAGFPRVIGAAADIGAVEVATFIVSKTNDSGVGSLRQAVLEANAHVGHDTIEFALGLTGTITLTSGEIAINEALTITGPGADVVTVSGNKTSRIFNIAGVPAPPTGVVGISGLTLTGGAVNAPGGAIFGVNEALGISDCVFTGNSAKNGGAIALTAGGLFSAIGCRFIGNSASFLAGAVTIEGVGSQAVFFECTVSGNSAQQAGGLYARDNLRMAACTISGNSATNGSGGGIMAGGTFAPTSLFILNSTLSGNSAAGNGGGIIFINFTGEFPLQNSTVINNTAAAGAGGGIRVDNGPGTIAVESSIVFGNVNATAPDISSFNKVTVKTSVLSSSAGFNETDLGGNLQTGIDLKLGPLADNGGPTLTYMPAEDSPLINGGSNPASQVTDQRGSGFPRVVGSVIDIGAVEGLNFVVRNIADSGVGSLREAILHANAFADSNTITFDPAVFGTTLKTIVLISGELIVSQPITIPGPGSGLLVVNGSDASRIFNLGPAPTKAAISISGMTMTAGRAPLGGGAIRTLDEVVTLNDCILTGNVAPTGGGAIYSPDSSKLTLTQCSLINNRATFGGALATGPATQTFLIGCTISGNVADYSGGIEALNHLFVDNCTISNNSATVGDGGGIVSAFVAGALTIRNSVVSGNTAAGSGGGIALRYLFSGTLDVQNCTINDNTAGIYGGGIAGLNDINANLTLTSCTLQGNKANVFGGAVFMDEAGKVSATNCSFISNTAAVNGGAIAAFDLVLRSCTVSGNMSVGGAGGGISVYSNDLTRPTVSLVVDGCTISNNTSNKFSSGGGIDVAGKFAPDASVLIQNSTISGNTSASGGGILVNASTSATLVVENSTFTANTANAQGGAIFFVTGTVQLHSTIVAQNASPDGPDLFCFFPINVPANNTLVGVADKGNFALIGIGNNTGMMAAPFDAKLGPLADNGGPTLTHRPLPGSPAINAGNNKAGFTNDQRGPGFPRVVGTSADIGALELQPAPCVAGIVINDGAVQRSRVTSIRIDFDQRVTLPAIPFTAFQLERVSDNALVGLDALVTIDADTHVTLTFKAGAIETGAGFVAPFSLQDGRYRLTIFATDVAGEGGQLDGDCNGTGGDNFVLIGDPATNKLFRFFGDSDADGSVAANDFIQFRLALGGTNAIFDFDGDGAVAASDFIQFRLRFGGSI